MEVRRTSENSFSTHYGEWDEWRVCWGSVHLLTFTDICRLPPEKTLNPRTWPTTLQHGLFAISLSGALRARSRPAGKALVMRPRILLLSDLPRLDIEQRHGRRDVHVDALLQRVLHVRIIPQDRPHPQLDAGVVRLYEHAVLRSGPEERPVPLVLRDVLQVRPARAEPPRARAEGVEPRVY